MLALRFCLGLTWAGPGECHGKPLFVLAHPEQAEELASYSGSGTANVHLKLQQAYRQVVVLTRDRRGTLCFQ